ncbi:hypothetical protein KP79_PYT22260 [Mizuhopecten yessoensis]|uniref:Uncharacterized protein n=1 Tax=Mizuhopecten yessoensis TaxID=6573 RepID=A0A210QDM1_MIZYE|nr:hypothetical protein KP79_PYT22260 [Mizuhopecten yessoensis]
MKVMRESPKTFQAAYDCAVSGAKGLTFNRDATGNDVMGRFIGSRYGADWDTEGYALPTLVDLTGFADEDTALIEEILRLIFYGKIKEESNINEIFSFAKDWGIEALQTKYALTQTSDERKIDRAIFVASAIEEIPKNLIRCFLKAAQPKGRNYTRAIPVFGILTHADLASQQIRKFENLEGNFIRALVMIGFKTRYMKCSNYCDDVDPELTRMEVSLPELDIPVLKFMVEVCDASYDISISNQTYTQAIFAQIAGPLTSTRNISCIWIFICFVLITIVIMMVSSAMVILSVM